MLWPMLALVAAAAGVHPDVVALAGRWEPDLTAELGGLPAPFDAVASPLTPCVAPSSEGARRCVPGAYVIGAWQCGVQKLRSALRHHPSLESLTGSDACYATWRDDAGGRAWVRRVGGVARNASKLVAALGCISMMQYYPGFAGRFHKWWEQSYWPCKGRCMDDRSCARTYYSKGQWATCKPAALAAHDAAVALPNLHSSDGMVVNATPPLLLSALYGPRPPALIALLRDPVDRYR